MISKIVFELKLIYATGQLIVRGDMFPPLSRSQCFDVLDVVWTVTCDITVLYTICDGSVVVDVVFV
jgi:hypothetical protein